MDRPDDLDRKSAEILAMFKHGDGDDYWRAVHAVGSLVAELVELRGFRAASLAYLRGPIGGVIEEADALVAEVERLREENAALAQTSADPCLACGWRFFVPGDGCQGCLVEQLRKDTKRYVAEERAAVVAWLREQVSSAMLYRVDDVSVDAASAGVAMLLGHVANSIECGDHRREEER